MTASPIPASKIIVRFAPSPTGELHIGSARAALFNWLYARHHGGKFLLRIEDTDRARSTEPAIAAILDGLEWLELDWDDEPIYQFSRAARHQEIAEGLLARGKAYKCYCSPAEIEAARDAAKAENKARKEQGRGDFLPELFLSPWRDKTDADAPAGLRPAIRLKAPREGETVVEDQVLGRVGFPNKDLDDLIILRSDGTPTYNLAVVVDDHDMAVTHVIRGVDHLTNTARQTQIYLGMDWTPPIFAHLPLIHGPDGAKLSKRHGAQGVASYRAMGYLPVAMRNYLVRLGWSHGDDETMSTEQMIAWFDLDAVGKSPARFDFAKLGDLNGQYIRQTRDKELIARIKATLPEMEGGAELAQRMTDAHWQALEASMPGLKERAKTLKDLVDGARYLFASRPLALDEKAAKLLDGETRGLLAAMLPQLTAVADWSAANIEAEVRRFAEGRDLKLGKIAQPLRAAATGSTISPPIFDVLQVLGREEALARLQDQAKG